MIGIHYMGQVFWFDFPHTLESQDQLIARLEREARRCYIRDAQKRIQQNFAIFGKEIEEAAQRTLESMRAFAQAVERMNNHPMRALSWQQKAQQEKEYIGARSAK